MTDQAPISDADRADARTLWDFHQMGHELRPCSAAITLGSLDLGVATTTAELYHAGMFPTVVFTGDTSAATQARFPRGEATHYREHTLSLGVPDEAILLEPKATNTGQNIGFSREALENAGIVVTTLLLISMPYMQRRAYATCRKLWPEVEPVCVSQPLPYDEYVTTHDDEKQLIDMLMGDMERVMEYPKRGFAIEQHVPARVRDAFERLRARGYDRWLLPA
jgi:uncharacterized SAM-binding protein YcdF (DUF218 family)